MTTGFGMWLRSRTKRLPTDGPVDDDCAVPSPKVDLEVSCSTKAPRDPGTRNERCSQTKPGTSWATLKNALVVLLLCSSFATFIHMASIDNCSRNHDREASSHGEPSHHFFGLPTGPMQSVPRETLVVYVYSGSDALYDSNFRYFIREGVHENDGCEYVFIIQQEDGVNLHSLPILPRYSRYVLHNNECFDWGTFGWAVERGHIQPEKYKYVILVNSSVRGPFFPLYWPRDIHWSRVLISRLNERVKLVGPTISCEGTEATSSHPRRQNPHVQSYTLAMDQVAYRLLADNRTVFQCYSDMRDTIYYSELGASRIVLEAGYNIDSLMLRYQGVDWKDERNWECNGGVNPYAEDTYDGISVSPMEVLFVKVKEFMLLAGWSAPKFADKYDKWSNQLTAHSISSNAYLSNKDAIQRARVWAMKQYAPQCFDLPFYLSKNPDLPQWLDVRDAWNHFLHYGQFEGRPWRRLCHDLVSNQEPVVMPTPNVPHHPEPVQPQPQHSADGSPTADIDLNAGTQATAVSSSSSAEDGGRILGGSTEAVHSFGGRSMLSNISGGAQQGDDGGNLGVEGLGKSSKQATMVLAVVVNASVGNTTNHTSKAHGLAGIDMLALSRVVAGAGVGAAAVSK